MQRMSTHDMTHLAVAVGLVVVLAGGAIGTSVASNGQAGAPIIVTALIFGALLLYLGTILGMIASRRARRLARW